MANELILANRIQSNLSESQRSELQIATALTKMAFLRGGAPTPEYLEVLAERLSKEPLNEVLAVIEQIASTARRGGEPALPDFGTIRGLVLDRRHPLSHLRAIVRKLALNFGDTPSEQLMELFQEAVGHRVDADLDAACTSLLRDGTLKRMPTTGQFLQSCGICRERRKTQ